ncbi:hypothetical protein AB0C34_17475 [Nocardia sp. NPDC049220]|uniref:hypothetical protein n=1 Tax=Nocardia sp. NPDC049220 TaxID=3155273 RepID=UPI003400684E
MNAEANSVNYTDDDFHENWLDPEGVSDEDGHLLVQVLADGRVMVSMYDAKTGRSVERVIDWRAATDVGSVFEAAAADGDERARRIDAAKEA